MSNVDLSEFEQITRGPGQCAVVKRIEQLPKKADREKAIAALAAPHITASAISKWFAARGVRIDDGTVGKHRKGQCCCA